MLKKYHEAIRKWTLHNAWKYNGRANPGAVIGKLLAEFPELKQQMKELAKEVNDVVKDVNSTSLEKITAELQKLAPELMEEKHEVQKKELAELPNAVKGNVVTRFAPSPSGPLHVGHAFVLALNAEYAKKYNGRFILRIEDTNPENLYEPAFKMIQDEAKWLTNNFVSSVAIQSDRLGSYYDAGEKLVLAGKAYVCTCNPDIFRDLIVQKKACACRNLAVKESHKRWLKMFNEYKPGEAVLRIKTELNDPNPAMRDWPAMRINDHKHPRTGTKYKVWPLMNLAVAVDDHDLGVTHTIRGKDHMDNAKRQKVIHDFMGWKEPTHLYFGMINFEGMELSATETRKKIEYGEFDDWEDIRLPFLAALRRRGYQPEAFVKFAIAMGVNLNDKTLSKEEFFKLIDSFNREIIDPKAARFFFVWNPVKVAIKNAPALTAEVEVHPDFSERGSRKLKFDGGCCITKDDLAGLKSGKLYRLMGCCNFTRKGKEFIYDSREVEKYREKGEGIIHWLPKSDDLVNVEVMMPDKTLVKGFGEPTLKKVKVDEVVQFERFGFCRCDRKEKDKMIFWFAHR